jgi:Na+/H+ antiporter NhaD/arsenite permease-like protein
VKNTIFYVVAILIAFICLYAMHDIDRQYPLDYSDKTYSYKKIFRGTIIGIGIVLLATFLIYILSKSFEVAISLGAYFLCFVLCYFVWGLFYQRCDRNRGARKED